MKSIKNQDKKELEELKKIENAIREGFKESEKFLKKEAKNIPVIPCI